MPVSREDEISTFLAQGLWGETTLADHVAKWRRLKPDAAAFSVEGQATSWADYDTRSTALAIRLADAGLQPGDRVATLLADGPQPHIAWLATEKAGLVAVGIGPRAGDREVLHLVEQSGARAMVSDAGGRDFRPLLANVRAEGRPLTFLELEPAGSAPDLVGLDGRGLDGRGLGASEVFMLNSTSGTTGLPKLVTHTQNRWFYFHRVAADAAALSGDDVFCSAIPAPFGFGLWTAHFTPAVLGCPTHLLGRFDADRLVELLAAERVSVLAAVSTQLIMMLNSPVLDRVDMSSLRVVFTGGEAVPYGKAAAFEDRTGCRVLQFYGSNETGAASCTTLADDRQHRLTTAGRVIDEMQVRLFDPATLAPLDGAGRAAEPGAGGSRRGQPGCRGPATCEGYYGDPAANEQLFTPDGWMLMGDIVEIDADGYLSVVGRTSDIIIRGGKNISAAAVEAEVMTHPSVAVAAAVAMPDPVFGERVCVYVQLRPGRTIRLDELTAHLAGRGVTKEWFPERLVEMEELPRSSGGKVAKGELRAHIARLAGAESGGED